MVQTLRSFPYYKENSTGHVCVMTLSEGWHDRKNLAVNVLYFNTGDQAKEYTWIWWYRHDENKKWLLTQLMLDNYFTRCDIEGNPVETLKTEVYMKPEEMQEAMDNKDRGVFGESNFHLAGEIGITADAMFDLSTNKVLEDKRMYYTYTNRAEPHQRVMATTVRGVDLHHNNVFIAPCYTQNMKTAKFLEGWVLYNINDKDKLWYMSDQDLQDGYKLTIFDAVTRSQLASPLSSFSDKGSNQKSVLDILKDLKGQDYDIEKHGSTDQNELVKSYAKPLDVTNVNDLKKKVNDVQVWGNGDAWQLLGKASSESQGWMKSSKAYEIEGVGCIVQVTTQNFDNVAEAVVFVPDTMVLTQLDDQNVCIGRRLVKWDANRKDRVEGGSKENGAA